MLPDLNRSERKALLLGTVLVLAGATARLGLGPDEASWAWSSAGPAATGSGELGEVRDAVAGSRERAARIATPLADDEKLDPNRAPDVELQRLPGVGPVLARTLTEHRRETPFRRMDDLLEVRGIGPATLRRIAPYLDLPDALGDGGAPAGPAAGRRGRLGPDATAGGTGLTVGGRVALNRAGRAELESLPGVGPVLAERILDHRRRHGRFERVEDLLEVPGIGPARLDDVRPRVMVW